LLISSLLACNRIALLVSCHLSKTWFSCFPVYTGSSSLLEGEFRESLLAFLALALVYCKTGINQSWAFLGLFLKKNLVPLFPFPLCLYSVLIYFQKYFSPFICLKKYGQKFILKLHSRFYINFISRNICIWINYYPICSKL
jgi:hypothetical protein